MHVTCAAGWPASIAWQMHLSHTATPAKHNVQASSKKLGRLCKRAKQRLWRKTPISKYRIIKLKTLGPSYHHRRLQGHWQGPGERWVQCQLSLRTLVSCSRPSPSCAPPPLPRRLQH